MNEAAKERLFKSVRDTLTQAIEPAVVERRELESTRSASSTALPDTEVLINSHEGQITAHLDPDLKVVKYALIELF
ncbi:MAG: hypothetical protein AAF589_04715 [Planctomycetota bacterium]